MAKCPRCDGNAWIDFANVDFGKNEILLICENGHERRKKLSPEQMERVRDYLLQKLVGTSHSRCRQSQQKRDVWLGDLFK